MRHVEETREVTPTTTTQFRKLFALLLAGSIFVHVLALAWIYFRTGSISTHAFDSLDCEEYYKLAQNIVAHGTFSQSLAPPLMPDTWRTPGYPLFLSGAMLLVGNSPTALILIQHGLATASVLIFFSIVSQYANSRRALLASLIFLLEPYHLLYTFWLLSTSFFTFMLLLTWWFWEKARYSARLWHYPALGLLSGFIVLIWPGAILVPFAVMVGIAIMKLRRHHITKLADGVMPWALVIAGSLLPPTIWMSRNQLVAGHFALSHQSGIVLAYFKATEVDLWRRGRTEDRYLETSLEPSLRIEPHPVWEGIDAELAGIMNALCVNHLSGSSDGDPCKLDELTWSNLAQGNKTSHDSFEISRVLSWIAVRMLLESPLSAIACGGIRIVENLIFPLALAIKPAKGASVNRIKALALGVAYSLLVLAAAANVARAWKLWPALYFPTACIVALALTTTPQIDPRFRVPLIPCLAFLALLPARRPKS